MSLLLFEICRGGVFLLRWRFVDLLSVCLVEVSGPRIISASLCIAPFQEVSTAGHALCLVLVLDEHGGIPRSG